MRSNDVKVVPVSESEKDVLANLMQLYRYDSSEYNDDEIDPSGKFDIGSYFDFYWTEAERHPFFIKSEDQLVGFALVREFEPAKYSIAEFFVARKYRRSGIGKRAAYLLFNRFSGEWHVAQEEDNIPAQLFWRAIIAEYCGGDFEESASPSQPKGPKQIFRSRDA